MTLHQKFHCQVEAASKTRNICKIKLQLLRVTNSQKALRAETVDGRSDFAEISTCYICKGVNYAAVDCRFKTEKYLWEDWTYCESPLNKPQ